MKNSNTEMSPETPIVSFSGDSIFGKLGMVLSGFVVGGAIGYVTFIKEMVFTIGRSGIIIPRFLMIGLMIIFFLIGIWGLVSLFKKKEYLNFYDKGLEINQVFLPYEEIEEIEYTEEQSLEFRANQEDYYFYVNISEYGEELSELDNLLYEKMQCRIIRDNSSAN